MSDGYLVEVNQVTKRYGAVTAVRDVSVRIAPGEVYGLVGANGAGKSTLIRMIVGLTAPDAGEVRVCGENVARKPEVKRRLGYLPEELHLYERLTGREYLELVAGLKGAEPHGISDELKFFGLAAAAEKWIGGYSLGMRKKIGLAAALLGAPDVLMLDEPLNGLDVEMMRQVRLRIADERARGRAVLVSSHVMSFVERACQRVGIIRAGVLAAEGTPDQLRIQANLPEAPFEDVFFRLAMGHQDDSSQLSKQ